MEHKIFKSFCQENNVFQLCLFFCFFRLFTLKLDSKREGGGGSGNHVLLNIFRIAKKKVDESCCVSVIPPKLEISQNFSRFYFKHFSAALSDLNNLFDVNF